jgi:hypothetical protein
MRLKPEILQVYRGTTQTKGKNLKPGKFLPRGVPKWGMESSAYKSECSIIVQKS